MAVCSNNCKGVEETAIIVGGGVLAAASVISGTSMLAPFSAAGMGLLGMAAMNRGQNCPEVCKTELGECIRGRTCQKLKQLAELNIDVD